MTAPHLRYLHLSDARGPNRGRNAPSCPPEVLAVLALATPAGTLREAWLGREQLARLIEAAGAVIRRADVGEQLDGYVWCDTEGAIHEDTADPYGEGEPCDGPHHRVYLDPDRDT